MSAAADKVAGSNELSGKYRFIAEIGHGGMSEVYLTVTRGGFSTRARNARAISTPCKTI